MTNIEKLETAIRKALPELMELSEGCVLHRKKTTIHRTFLITQ